MNKLVSAAILSVGVSIGAQNASAGDFGSAFLSGGLFDAMTETKTQKQEPKKLETGNTIQTPEIAKGKIGNTKRKVQDNVIQIVGLKSIPTTLGAISEKKWYDCKQYNNTKYYFSYKNQQVAEDIFFDIKKSQVEKMHDLPKCKK